MTDVYQPLILKYRPTRVKDLVDQVTVVRQLQGMFKTGRVPQTFLICGPYGCGKTTVARMLAAQVNCQSPDKKTGDPCGTCASCKMISQNITYHPDIREMNGAKERGIDDMRNLAEISQMSPRFNRRVFIIDEAHMLTGPAFQSMLKVFEEPAKRTLFMLVTNMHDKIPGTIQSRCFKIELKQPNPEKLAKKLLSPVAKKEGVKLHPKLLIRIADSVRGRPRDALSVLERVLISVGGKDIPPEKIAKQITKIVKEVVPEPPEVQVEKFLKGCLKSTSSALTILDKVKEPAAFVEMAAQIVRYATLARYKDAPGYCQTPLARMFRNVDMNTMAAVSVVIAECYRNLIDYRDSMPHLTAMALQIMNLLEDDEDE